MNIEPAHVCVCVCTLMFFVCKPFFPCACVCVPIAVNFTSIHIQYCPGLHSKCERIHAKTIICSWCVKSPLQPYPNSKFVFYLCSSLTPDYHKQKPVPRMLSRCHVSFALQRSMAPMGNTMPEMYPNNLDEFFMFVFKLMEPSRKVVA